MILFRCTAIRPLRYRERKHTAPLYIIMAADADEAARILREREPDAVHHLPPMPLLNDDGTPDQWVSWTYHHYTPAELAALRKEVAA